MLKGLKGLPGLSGYINKPVATNVSVLTLGGAGTFLLGTSAKLKLG
jgi:hypothetical protein